jgi:hypothetical protein
MATLHRERKVMYLDDLMTIVENAESNRPNLPSISTATASSAAAAALTAPTAAPGITASTVPTPVELDAVSVRGRGRGRGQDREKCSKCGGYGHHSYQCGTPNVYKPGGGQLGRGRDAMGGRMIGEVRNGMLYALGQVAAIRTSPRKSVKMELGIVYGDSAHLLRFNLPVLSRDERVATASTSMMG